MIQVKFKKWMCNVIVSQYPTLNPAIRLDAVKDGDSITVATINVPSVYGTQTAVVIKEYGGNDNIQQILQDAGIISAPLGWEPLSYCMAPVCKLLVPIDEPNNPEDY